MQAPQGNKGQMPGSYPTQDSYPANAAYPPQPGFAPYGSSSSMPSQDPYMPNATTTDTDPMVKGFEFNTASIRRGFIRKVYSILSVIILLADLDMKKIQNSSHYLLI